MRCPDALDRASFPVNEPSFAKTTRSLDARRVISKPVELAYRRRGQHAGLYRYRLSRMRRTIVWRTRTRSAKGQ